MEKKSQIKNLLNYCKVSPEAKTPFRASAGAAGMDLCACISEDIILEPGRRALVPTGIAISLLSSEYAAFIFARSGLGIKHGITLSNGVGVIDSDYRGELKVGLCNLGQEPYTVKNGERIAQLVVMKVETPDLNEVETLDSTERGSGGFGSTGK